MSRATKVVSRLQVSGAREPAARIARLFQSLQSAGVAEIGLDAWMRGQNEAERYLAAAMHDAIGRQWRSVLSMKGAQE